MEFIGYASRAYAHEQTGRLMPFVIQQNYILLAPVLFAASIYMTLGRIIRSVNGEKYSLVSPKRLTRSFVSGDILALAVQGGAAGLMVVSQFAKLAQGILIAGLVLQILFFGLFWATAWMFHVKMRRSPCMGAIPTEVGWEQALRMLCGVSALIMGRSIFRLIEFTMGTDGYLLTHEWPMYIFDSLPMLAVTVIFWIWFPSMFRAPDNRLTSVTSMNDLVKNPSDGRLEEGLK